MDFSENKPEAKSAGETARSFSGRICPMQPGQNELLVVTSDRASAGCDLVAFPTNFAEKNAFDALKLFEEARPSANYFKMTGTANGEGKIKEGTNLRWGGSGVAVDKEDNACLVLTDAHVPDATPEQHANVKTTEVVMPDGQPYNSSVIARDMSKDLALVKVDTGAKTAELCHPAKIVDKEIELEGSQSYFNQPLLAIGQPYTSGAMYTSIGPVVAEDKRETINSKLAPLPGEDQQRRIVIAAMPDKPGFSGAGAFNASAEVVGLIDIGTSPKTTALTPISRATVDELKAKRTDFSK